MSELLDIVTVIALAVSAGAGFLLYKVSRDTARRKASFDHISRQTHDKDLIAMVKYFRGVKNIVGGENDIVYSEDFNARIVAGAITCGDAILRLLNYYEVTAIGVRKKALDEDIVKDWWRSTFVQDLVDLQDWVIKYRKIKSAPKAFCECYFLAYEWADENERGSVKPEFRQEPVPRSLWHP